MSDRTVTIPLTVAARLLDLVDAERGIVADDPDREDSAEELTDLAERLGEAIASATEEHP